MKLKYWTLQDLKKRLGWVGTFEDFEKGLPGDNPDGPQPYNPWKFAAKAAGQKEPEFKLPKPSFWDKLFGRYDLRLNNARLRFTNNLLTEKLKGLQRELQESGANGLKLNAENEDLKARLMKVEEPVEFRRQYVYAGQLKAAETAVKKWQGIAIAASRKYDEEFGKRLRKFVPKKSKKERNNERN